MAKSKKKKPAKPATPTVADRAKEPAVDPVVAGLTLRIEQLNQEWEDLQKEQHTIVKGIAELQQAKEAYLRFKPRPRWNPLDLPPTESPAPASPTPASAATPAPAPSSAADVFPKPLSMYAPASEKPKQSFGQWCVNFVQAGGPDPRNEPAREIARFAEEHYDLGTRPKKAAEIWLTREADRASEALRSRQHAAIGEAAEETVVELP